MNSLSSSDLEALALSLAQKHMNEHGSVPPTVFLATEKGLHEFQSHELTDVASKDKLVQTVRLLAVANNASATTIILECWARTASRPGGPLGDRQESLIIVTETPGAPRVLLLGIRRNSQGKFVKFIRVSLLGLIDLAGRFAGLLPRKPPTAQDQHQARVLLGMFGIQPDGKPIPSHLN